MARKKRSFREWLIYKLGGYITTPLDIFPSNDWTNVYIEENFFISKDHCKPEYIENIENELASVLAKRLIKDGDMRFKVFEPNDFKDHLHIYGGINILRLREPNKYSLPNHISFDTLVKEINYDDPS